MRSELDTRGKTSMFVGYADDHAGDVYRFMNIQTKRIILSREAKWLNLFWKHYKMRHNIPRRQQVGLFLDEGSDPEENRIGAREETLGRTWSQTKEMVSPRNEFMERADLTMEDWIQETCLISAVTSGPTEPKHFKRHGIAQLKKKEIIGELPSGRKLEA